MNEQEQPRVLRVELTGFGKKVEELRIKRYPRESVEYVAKQIGWTRQYFRKIENGEYDDEPPTVDTFFELFQLFTEQEDRDELIPELLTIFIGHEDAQRWRRHESSKPLQNQPLAQQLLQSLKPITDRWEDSNASTYLYGLITGSVIGLLHGLELFVANPKLEPLTWHPPDLLANFEAMLEDIGGVDWEYTNEVVMWSHGYFLNKSTINLSRAIELCVNEWLIMKGQVNEQTEKNESVQQNDFAKSLADLKESFIQSAQAVPDKIDDLLSISNSRTSVADAIKVITNYANNIERSYRRGLRKPIDDITRIFNDILNTRDDKQACIVAVLDRAKFLEHGTPQIRRRGFGYVIEWVTTAKATLWTVELWHAMLRDIGYAKTD